MHTPRTGGDITQGVIWKQLLAFFFPLWFGTFFQQLYNTVDTLVVGRFVGKTALAAVGSTGTVVALIVGIFTGLASGAVVFIAQHYGARDAQRVGQGVHTAMLLGVIIGAVFMAAGFFLTPWILRTMDTTAESMPGAQTYLRIYFLGMIPNVVYNMGTGVLRAIGDSRRPLYFLMAASLCNIVLDLFLVISLDMGVAGAAIATVISQVLSAVLVVLSLLRAAGQPYQLFPGRLRLHRATLRAILWLGIPSALQSMMYTFSSVVIQAAINHFGTDTVAAWTAYSKMDILFWMSINAMGLALTTFAGQNYGAGKLDRLKKGVRTAVWISAVFTVLLSVVLVVGARPLLSIFCPDPDVLGIGISMVRFLAPTYITYVLIELLAGAIRGAGRVMGPTVISLLGVCVLRLVWIFTLVPLHNTVNMVAASYPITWSITSIALLVYYYRGHWLRPTPQLERAEAVDSR